MAKEYMSVAKGISRLEQDNGYTIIRLHYSADPVKDDIWIKREKAAYPYVELWQQEMELDFISSAGKRVYPEFGIERNVAPLKKEPYNEIWRGWDFGYGHPAVVWTQRTHDGHFHILASMMAIDKTIQVFAKEVIDVGEKLFPGSKYKDAGDPACRQHNDKSEQTTADILRVLYGIRMQSRPTRVKDGIGLIRTMLTPRPDGFVCLKVHKDCELIIDGFLDDYVRDDSDAPVKDNYYDHSMDALRYVATILFDLRTGKALKQAQAWAPKRLTANKTTGY